MAGFRVGDRVRVRDIEDNRLTATLYPHVAPGSEHVIDQITELGWVQLAGYPDKWVPKRFELIAPAPRKDTPAVGDTVRLLLEGKVYHTDGDGDFGIRSALGDNWIVSAAQHVKSIEILQPAKPSVKDLPDRSVIRGTLDVVAVKTGENYWVGTNGATYTDADFDMRGWTLLVEKESE